MYFACQRLDLTVQVKATISDLQAANNGLRLRSNELAAVIERYSKFCDLLLKEYKVATHSALKPLLNPAINMPTSHTPITNIPTTNTQSTNTPPTNIPTTNTQSTNTPPIKLLIIRRSKVPSDSPSY